MKSVWLHKVYFYDSLISSVSRQHTCRQAGRLGSCEERSKPVPYVRACSWFLLVGLEPFSTRPRWLSLQFPPSCLLCLLSLVLVFLSPQFTLSCASLVFFPFFLPFVTFSPPPPLPVGRWPICSNPALHCVVADAAGQTAVEPLYTEVYVPNRGVQQHVCQLV